VTDGPAHQPVLRLLGLAQRAGVLRVGANAVLRALREEKPGVVFLARDAGDGLAQRVARRLGESTLERTLLSSQELALAFGRERLAVVSVHDRGFVSGLRKQLAIRGEDS
jgi:ribosomal protein L7Ae-like RNA K-turn-binding protein